jgi:hypothetical protein
LKELPMSGNQDPRREWVQRVLGYRFEPPRGGPEGAAIRVAKGLLLWNNTRSHVARQIKVLQQAIRTQAAGEPDFSEIDASLGNLDELLEKLDDRLTVKLGELRATSDLTAKQKLSDEARDIVADYQKYVAEDGLVNEIDDNGFVPLDIKPTVDATLRAVLATI